jgi:hemerythrin-like domain-containing protein
MGTSGDARDRLAVLGEQMIEIHEWLRGDLLDLSDQVDAYLAGRTDRPRGLKAHCLAFCSAVGRHHTGEDTGAFPVLARDFPELRPVLDKLEQDHVLVRGLLHSLERLLAGIPDEPRDGDAERVRAELAGLSAILASHFSFEERRIVAALNSLPSGVGTAAQLFGLAAPDIGSR